MATKKRKAKSKSKPTAKKAKVKAKVTTKAKAKKEPVDSEAKATEEDAVEVSGGGDSARALSELSFDIFDDVLGETVQADFGGMAGHLTTQVDALASLCQSFDALTPEELIVAHTFVDTMAKRFSEHKKGVNLIASEICSKVGTVTCGLGTLKATEVHPSVETVFTDETVSLLETAGLLSDAVSIEATVHKGVNVAEIPADELEILQKYFDIEYVPDPEKINSLISLGKIDQKAVDKTTEIEQTRAGYTRVTVKPSDAVTALFDVEEVSDEEV